MVQEVKVSVLSGDDDFISTQCFHSIDPIEEDVNSTILMDYVSLLLE